MQGSRIFEYMLIIMVIKSELIRWAGTYQAWEAIHNTFSC
jgi:hypothetical protein